MRLFQHRVLAVVAGAAVVVGGADLAAYAAGGHSLFAGHHTARTAAARSAGAAHVYEYVIPKHTQAPFQFKAKDLPKGRYAVSLTIATKVTVNSPGSTDSPFCSVGAGHAPYAVFSYGVLAASDGDPGPTVAINTGSGLIKVAHKGSPTITCIQANRTYSSGRSKNIVVFTPLSKVTVGKIHQVALPTMRSSGSSHFGR